MSDFKAKMHQIRFPPQTPKLDLKGPTSKGREGREGKGEREGKEVEELGGEGRRGRGRGGGAIQCLASGRHRLSCATDKPTVN